MIRCKFEDGADVKLRHVCVNAIVVKDNKILLGKRGSHKGKRILESGKWGLIGGFFDRDEYLEEGLSREVREESGWEVDNIRLFRINDDPNRPAEDRQNIDIIFVADTARKISKSDEEITELGWFGIDELPEKENIAFDHWEHLEIYRKYLEKPFKLPVWGRQ